MPLYLFIAHDVTKKLAINNSTIEFHLKFALVLNFGVFFEFYFINSKEERQEINKYNYHICNICIFARKRKTQKQLKLIIKIFLPYYQTPINSINSLSKIKKIKIQIKLNDVPLNILGIKST